MLPGEGMPGLAAGKRGPPGWLGGGPEGGGEGGEEGGEGTFLYWSTESCWWWWCCDDMEAEEEEEARCPVAGTQMEQTEQKKVPSVAPVPSAACAK